MSNDELSQLASDLVIAKSTEAKAKAKRIEIEETIAAKLKAPEDGSKSFEAGEYKVTIKNGLLYSCNVEDLDALDIEPALRPIKTERKFDPKGYKWLKENDSATFAKVAEVVTVKPAKVSVTVKERDK